MARLLGTSGDLHADILVAPHHGRPNRLWPALLERVRPRAVVLSARGKEAAGELAAGLEASGCQVLATWRGGAVRIPWSDEGWRPEYWFGEGEEG